MKKVNRIISAIVLAAFLCNTFLVDASFAQDILRNGSSSTLSVALRSDDMLGVERQDISKISIWFRGCIDLISKKNQPVNLASLRDPKILPNDVIDGLKDFKFLRHSDLSQDTVTGVIRVKVRRRAGLSMKTYWAEYLPSEGRLRVYPDGAQVSLFAPHRSPAPNAREFDILGKAGPGGKHTNFDAAARHTVGMAEAPAKSLTEPGKNAKVLHGAALTKFVTESIPALAFAPLMPDIAPPLDILGFEFESCLTNATADDVPALQKASQELHNSPGYSGLKPGSIALGAMQGLLKELDDRIGTLSKQAQPAPTAKAPAQAARPERPDVLGKAGPGGDHSNFDVAARHTVGMPQVPAADKPTDDLDLTPLEESLVEIRIALSEAALIKGVQEVRLWQNHQGSVSRIAQFDVEDGIPVAKGMESGRWEGIIQDRFPDGGKVRIGSDSDSLLNMAAPLEPHDAPLKVISVVIEDAVTPSPMGKPGKPDVRGEVGSGSTNGKQPDDATKRLIAGMPEAPAETVKRTKAINEIWKGLSGQTDIRKPINLFTESMIEDDWVRVAVGSLAEEMIAGIEGLKIYSKAGEVPDVWGSTDIHEIYLKLTFKARLNSIRDRNLSARKLKAVKEWLIQESRKLAALDTSLNNTLLPLLSPVETMPETPAPVAAQELDNLGKQLEAQEAAEVKTVMGYVAILADTSETQARREEIHAKLVQEIKGNYRVTAIALVGLIAAGSNNARILEDTLLTNGPWAKTYEPVPQDIPKRFYVLAHALCMNYELLWRDFNESVEYMDRGKFDNVILSLNDYLATIENPRVYPEMPAQDRGRIVSTIKYILNALPPFRGELELSLMGNEMSDRLRIGFGNYYTRVYYNEAPIIGGPDSSLSSELWKGSSLVTIGLDTNGEQVVVVEDKFLEFVRKFFSKQMSNGRPVDMSKFPSTIVGESDARAKGLRPLIPERSLEAPAELKNLPAQMPVKKDDGYYVTIAGKSLAITADIACLLKGNPARHDGWRRKLAPAKVRKELNRLKEIIATRPLDMSLSGIKTLLETENFKYIQLDTLTDVSAVTKDRVAYEDGHGVPCLPSCNAGPIKYLVIAKYSKGIIRKKEYILPIVLALDARILHSRARDFVLSAFVCPKSLSDVLYIVKAGMFGAYATSASPAAETPAPAAASLDEANARARAREETAHELVFHIVHSGRASIQLPFIVDELSRFNNVTKFRLFIELLSAELRAGRRFENKEITQELLDRVVFDTLVRRYAETPAFAGPVPELMAAMRPILIDLDVQMIGCQVSIERNGESVIISITNPADKKDVMGFQLNKYVDGERISFTITPFRNKTFYKMESASSETEFIGLVKTVLERFKSYAYWKEWLKSAQEEETIFSVEPAAASAPTGTFQPDVAFVYALSAGTPAPAVPAAAPALSAEAGKLAALVQRAVWGRGITTYSGDRFTVDTAVENGPTGFPDAGQANQSAILKAIEKQIAETRDLRMLQAAKGLIEARQVSSPQAVPTESISESQAFGEYIAKLEDRIRVVRASPKDGGEDAHFFSERVPHMTATELAHYVMNSSIGYVQACIA
ncbi:MAG: hypothetical protein NT036_04365, partial [Candidatus Omnitrophica bacterium]|nr:hypothetical protein [Candidatus Omnitrophota bacterium]